MERNKVIFLDRDGTINIDYGYVYQKEKLEFIDGAIEGLKNLSTAGYKLIIITNQSGIGRCFFTEEDYAEFNNYFLGQLKLFGIEIEKVYYCPHTDSDNCECRKPKLKLFYDAIEEFNVDLSNSYAIGDKERDLAICNETSIKGILIGNKSDKYLNFSNLLDAANYITKESD